MSFIDYNITRSPVSKTERVKQIFKYTKSVLKWAFLSLLVCFLSFLLLIFSMQWINPPFTAFTLQEDWESLEGKRYNLKDYWVEQDSIPQNIKWAVVASEDQRFWEHPGVDIAAIGEAWEEMENGERVRGASTITQQVTKNLFLSGDKTFFRKGVEAVLAVTIDAMWSKERIMEVYLNIAEFGPGVYGIGKASDHFFTKKAFQMNEDEAARMAAVLPNPKRMRVEPASPYVAKRKTWILKNMTNLSGIAYYKAPQQEVKPDSSETDSVDIFDIPFFQKLEIPKVGLSVSEKDSTESKSFDS